MSRRCPNCGEMVPSNSITCPKCYKKIPVEPVRQQNERPEGGDGSKTPWKPNLKVALLLNLILGLFGVLGIGQLYCGKRRGLVFLAAGLLFFGSAMIMIFAIPGISWILCVPLFVIYALIYLVCLAETVLNPIIIGMHR